MKKLEIYDKILEKVCEECMVRVNDVLIGRKFQAVVDARILCVQYMRRIGLSYDDIALISLKKVNPDLYYIPTDKEWKSKSKSVAKMFAAYSERCLQDRAFCIISKEINTFCQEAFNDEATNYHPVG